MGGGGRANGHQVHLAKKFAPIDNSQHAVLRHHGAAGLGAGIGNRIEFDAGDMAVLGAVMTAESAGANDGDLQRSLLRNTAAQKHSPSALLASTHAPCARVWFMGRLIKY